MPQVRFSTDFNPGVFADELFAQIRQVIDDEMIEAAAELQQESPVGATRELQEGWDVIPAKRRPNSFDVQGSVINTADHAAERIRGRGPGKFPNVGSLREWVQDKIENDPKQANAIAYLIGRKIAREGTDRYQAEDGNNFAGLKRDGKLTDNAPITRASRRISERLSNLQIDSKRKIKRRR